MNMGHLACTRCFNFGTLIYKHAEHLQWMLKCFLYCTIWARMYIVCWCFSNWSVRILTILVMCAHEGCSFKSCNRVCWWAMCFRDHKHISSGIWVVWTHELSMNSYCLENMTRFCKQQLDLVMKYSIDIRWAISIKNNCHDRLDFNYNYMSSKTEMK